MPVSVVCETTANVNAALRESLGSGGSCSAAANAKASDENKTNGSSASASDEVDSSSSLHGKLVASAKRVLLSKIDYEEVTNYGQTVLDSLKSKYIVLKPSSGIINSMENGRSSPATCNNNNNGANGDSSAADANGNTTNTNGTAGGCGKRQHNPNELPAPKRILYPRENVRIGWKATGRKWDVGVGMMNVGNTCYLNSTLQALFHVPSMANWLMSDSTHMERCESSDSGCIICAMTKTLQASQNSQSAIRPYFVYSKLKSICKHLVMGRQEDAHEFLRYLVEAMEKSYLSRFRNFKELDQYSKETTPLNQILGGYLKTSVKCLSCQHVSVTFQHFQDLLLDIRKADTIDEALEGYFARERLEDMGYKCEACKKKVSATKQFSLDRAPIALCIQLKRFSMLGTKLNKQITIKPRLDLTKFASRKIPGEQLTYRLVAMVTHLGASQHCGHYTAIGLTESGTYYNYDDSYVRPISMQNVCNTNAYIIFYEMDTQPPRQVTSTQVSGAQQITASNPKELQTQKMNGHVVIGPQLPPGYSNGNGSIPSSPLANGGSKLILNRGNATTTTPNNSSNNASSSNSSKIMIHFKNNNATSNTPIKTSAATSSITSASATSSTTSSTPTAAQSAFDSLKNSTNNNNYNNSNGLHIVGTGKFQEPANAKYSLGGPTNKRQTNNAKNGNESSSDDDGETEIVSSSTTTHSANSQATLPSMPKLGVELNSNSNNTSTSKPLTNGFAKKSPAPIKSLVPYGSETDEESDVVMTTTSATTSSMHEPQKRLLPNPLKRRQSSSSWSNGSSSSDNDNGDDNDKDSKPTTGTKIKKAVSSTTTIIASAAGSSGTHSKLPLKYTTDSSTSHHNGVISSNKSADTIDDIFNSIKRSNNNNNINSATNGVSSSPLKKKSQNQQFTVTSTTPTTDSSASNSDNEDHKSSRPQFKRSHSTPPSPPVVKTNSGVWQVTSLHPISACVSPTAEQQQMPPKNPKNPFASKPSPLQTVDSRKRHKKDSSSNKHNIVGNGYQRDTASDSAVSELLKQSHRGYGAPILTWNGQQSEIERENYYLFDEKRIEDDNDNTNKNSNNNNYDDNDHEQENHRDNNSIIKENHSFNDNFEDTDKQEQIGHHNNIDLITTTTIRNFIKEKDIDDDSIYNDFDFDDDDAAADEPPPQLMVDESGEDDNTTLNKCQLLIQRCSHRHHLRIDLNINNNCQQLTPLLENCTNLMNEAPQDEAAATTATSDEQNNIDSCSSATTATTVINTYCLSPNSTDNEPTTPTLATTINDIIFQFSEDSLDNL